MLCSASRARREAFSRATISRPTLCYFESVVPLRDAVDHAIAFASETLGAAGTQGIRVEEVDVKPESWLITLSMIDPDESENGLAAINAALGSPRKRAYKVFTVRRDTGEIVTMKIREFAQQ